MQRHEGTKARRHVVVQRQARRQEVNSIHSFPLRLVPTSCLCAFVPTCLFLAGCVEQTMTVDSNPPGALVYLNDQEVGRTPVTKDFKWYGDYDIQLRLEGYETLKTHKILAAPAWNWVPMDLFAYLVPVTLKDHKSLSYTLKPLDPSLDQPAPLVDRAENLRDQLEVSPFTRVPMPRAATTTQATTKPSTQK
jgi:hypothetical protein